MPGVNVQKKEMAHFHSPTTFCEVTYDSDWMNFDDDRHLTPYRYSLMRNNDVETNSDTVSLTLPSYTYYEYLRSLYDCRTTPSRVHPGYHGPPGSHISQQGRATTWHAFNKENGSELSRQAVRSEPTRIRPTYPFPSLHLMQGGDESGDELDNEFIYADRSNEKLVWVDALNKWVPQKKLQPRPYMSFIGNVPVIEKQGKFTKELVGVGDDENVVQSCERFEVHMGKQTSGTTTTTQPQVDDKSAINRERNNEKRETIRRRAQELAEQRRQRKAYSTPLYTSMNERKQNMKQRVQSSRTHSSLPVSPIHHKDKAPSPKHVWQPDEGAKLRTIHEPKSEPEPIKREISITLLSPQPDELADEVDLEDLRDKGSEKKVTFTDQQTDSGKDTPKSGKKSKEDDLASNNADEEARLTEQRLIESLEKQRLLQIEQQQNLLAEEERRKEKERKEKERLEEDERMRKLKESHEKRKQPLISNNHENHYENTMNAAGLLFSQSTYSDLTEKSKTELSGNDVTDSKDSKGKTVKTDLKKESKQSQETKNNLKNIKVKENIASNDIEKEKQNVSKPKPPKLEKSKSDLEKPKKEKPKTKDDINVKESKKPEMKSVTILPKLEEEKEKKFVKIIDKMEDKTEGLVRENTDNSMKLSKGKRRKGKGNAAKSQPKPAKVVEKVPKKSKKNDEDKYIEKKLKPLVKPKKELPAPTSSEKVAKPLKKLKKEIPAPKPMLAGMGAPAKQVPALSQVVVVAEETEKLPITEPTSEPTEPVEEVSKPKSPAQERRRSLVQQREVVKKEKRDGRKCVKKAEEEVKQALPEPEIEPTEVESWIYGADDYSGKTDEEKETVHLETEPLPSLAGDLNPELIEKQKRDKKEKRRKGVLANLLNTDKAVKKWRKPGQLDSSYADELRRLELAEERRKRQMEMFDRLKNRKLNLLGEVDEDGSPRFEDYGFLAKYCIFTKGNIDMYRHAFEAVDEGKTGWLEGEDVMIALRGVNNRLTEAEEEYLYRVLELTGYKITHGADFKIFSVMAALSQRISALDKWMKNLIGQMDFKALEMKMFKCKTLWECNVDKETNSISIDQLCVDLRAGGVSFEHEMEVREKLAHLHSIDLLDFLTYIPLFIMIHEAVVKNPLSDVRDK